MPLDWQSGSQTPIAIHRGSWTDPDATYVGLKAGSPSASHGQMDIGSFVLDSQGVRWALDLGAEGYHRIEARGMNLWSQAQNSDRWKIFRQSNEGHNTLVIDGQLQKVSGNAPIVAFSDDRAFPHSIVDMTAVYEGQAGSARRGVALLDSRDVLIQDQLTGLKPGSRVRWGMITPGKPARAGAAAIELGQGRARLTLTILAPREAVWRTIDTARPHDWDSPNRGTSMIALRPPPRLRRIDAGRRGRTGAQENASRSRFPDRAAGVGKRRDRCPSDAGRGVVLVRQPDAAGRRPFTL